ncbi:hypothetical protein CPJCM30710_22370 [Clostridium polyendosporum]|uniref:DUF2383 domain-containing protein n=1 Tax=Clostridium polyendosporum TaxID=69208 RepID=A0A919S092_9CLOT|nr:DUF2383 domain-containing protein [Clostridium polyendosporum]GIM29571.1 hypothetical protein CPJCM30710_22370 [Clostridium polyendosporum]
MVTSITTREVVQELNQYLQGIYMGVDAFEKYVDKTKSEEIKGALSEIHSTYKRHAGLITNRISELGGEPITKVSLVGKLSEIYEDIKELTVNTDLELLEKAYDACKTGFIMGQKFLNESKNLDHSSYQLIKELVHDSEECATRISGLFELVINKH